MSIDLDHAALSAVTAGITGAAKTFDSCGKGVPTPDAGIASVILSDLLHSCSKAGVRLTTDGATLASLADDCNVDLATTDSAAAGNLLQGAP